MLFIDWNMVISRVHLLLTSITLKSLLPHFLEHSDAQHLCVRACPHMSSPQNPPPTSAPRFPETTA